MNRLIRLLALLALAGSAGCFSLSVAKTPGPDRHMLVRNYGWYLFDFVPLACGNASPNPEFPFVLFRDDVAVDKLQKRFMDRARELGRTPVDLTWHCYDTVLFQIASSFIIIPIPYLITYHEHQLSGVLK